MRRLIVVLSVMAILAFVAPAPQARADGGIGGFVIDNWYNAYASYPQIPYDNPGTYYSTLPNGPTATVDGMVWLKTGPGNPALYDNAYLMVSTYYKNTTGAWVLANTQRHIDGYAGYFLPNGGGNGGGEAWVVNDMMYVSSETIPVPDYGGALTTLQQGQFYQQFWTDPTLQSGGTSPYGTYAAANTASAGGASGVYVAQTVPFLVDLNLGGMGGLWLTCQNTGMYMPAVVLQKGVVASPEPSTLLLVVTGLVGLLAYAWRKRK
jgi:hypothetical protein